MTMVDVVVFDESIRLDCDVDSNIASHLWKVNKIIL